MNDEGAYYDSRLKLNSRIYRKNDDPEFFRNGTVKKGTLFIQSERKSLRINFNLVKHLKFQKHTLGSIKNYPPE